MKKATYTLLFLLFSLCCVHAAGPDTLVGAYYYPWYDNANFNSSLPLGNQTLIYHLDPQVLPALGWYNQKDAGVINQHYQWAEYAGIDFFVCSFWGSGSRTDNIIRNYMFNNPDRGDIKLCVFLEPSITPAGGATESQIIAQTNYLCDNYFDYPCYFHVDGKPVIFIYVTRAMSDANLTMCINAIRTAAANKGIGDVYIAGDEVWGSPSTSIDGPRVSQLDAVTNYDVYGNNGANSYVTDSRLDTWQSRNAAWKSLADSYGTDFIPAISPGYNDRGQRPESDHAACSRKLNDESNDFGTLFTGMIDRLEPIVEMVMINSWNEWHEDTQIEPTTVATTPTNLDDGVAFGYYTGFYTQDVYYEGYGMRYLDILREQFVSVVHDIPIGVSASGDNPPDETADEAFDSNVSTKWLDFSMIVNGSSWIQWRYTGGATANITEYAITSANDTPARDPMDWNLLGSNDGGATWDVLDSRTGETFTNRFQRLSFSISSPSSYNIYRLEITDIADFATANSVQLAELELIGEINPVCAGFADLNCDLVVDVDDLSYMAGVWLTDDTTADISRPVDAIVNLLDFSLMVQVLRDWLGDDSVAHWGLDDVVGTVASDASPNAYDGTLMNMNDNDWIIGVSGHALDFDGIDDYVKFTGYKGVTGTQARTCTAWISTTQTTTGEFVTWGSLGTGAKWSVGIKDGVLSVRVQGGSIFGSTPINSDGLWHHVAVTWEPDGDSMISNTKLYVNGIEETISNLYDIEINTTASEDVHVGNIQNTNYFQGQIDDVRIYDRVLSQAEIELLAQ